MDGTVLQTKRRDTHALALVHDQVQREILHEELGVVPQRLFPVNKNKSSDSRVTITLLRRGYFVPLAILAHESG